MKILEPSYHIQDDLDRQSIAVRLEHCGRVCYKSEDRITEDSAVPFVKNLAEHGHNSVLEMAVVTFRLTCHPDHVLELLSCQPKYLVVDRTETGMLVTGSIRAFRELYLQHPRNQLINGMVARLAEREPYLFINIFDAEERLPDDPQLKFEKLPLAEVDRLEESLRLRHRFVGVRFIVNRAVTHELVRHRPC